ncbi:DUF4349 domain-containing protein [Nocardiopsis flavescens]
MLSAGLAALLATSCAAPMNSQDSGAAGAPAPESAAREEYSEGAAGDGAPVEGGGTSGVDADVEVSDRRIVHTADLTVRVEDVAAAALAAKELAAGSGGHVASESLSTPSGGSPQAYLTLRIPAQDYEEALEELAALGDRSDLDRSVEDVTGEVADTESRIESAETALDTLRGYLEEAENVDELLRVEREIQDRQAELEAFQARLETLEDRTALSTVNLTLLPPRTYVEEPAEDGLGFLGGLERGWRSLLTVFGGIAVAVGWLLPFLAVLAVPAAVLVWWLRRRRTAPGTASRVPARAGAPGGPAAAGAGDGQEPPAGGSPADRDARDTPEGTGTRDTADGPGTGDTGGGHAAHGPQDAPGDGTGDR